MFRPGPCTVVILAVALFLAPVAGYASPAYASIEALGEALFFDVDLSANRTQACATCHAPGSAFIDPRGTAAQGAVSIGDDGRSVGTRNAPTLTYAAMTPDAHRGPDGALRGGFFYDGRAATLTEQAREPLLNPLEMALADADALRARIVEKSGYKDAIEALFGAETLTTSQGVMDAVAASLAAFERTPVFSTFDSKYDRYLRGEAELNRLEERGRLLFLSDLVNCRSCHLLDEPDRETFTDYTFHNIGVPRNTDLSQSVDLGLAANGAADAQTDRGKFKVPTLRNVAVTPPYMHNGVFRELRTVLVFYNTFTMRTPINPETKEPWGEAEVGENVSHDLLGEGQPLNEPHLEALLAFLNTLTDARYEHLLK